MRLFLYLFLDCLMLFPLSRTRFLPLTHSYSSLKIHFKSHLCQTTASSQRFACLASLFVVATLLSSSWTRLSKIFLIWASLSPGTWLQSQCSFPLHCNCWCTSNYEQSTCKQMPRFGVHGWALHHRLLSSPLPLQPPFSCLHLPPGCTSFPNVSVSSLDVCGQKTKGPPTYITMVQKPKV